MRARLVIQTALFIGVFYVALPAIFIALNEQAGWPRWESALGDAVGTLLIAAGIATFFYCAGLFRRFGLGTPAPNMPPSRLVVSGLYRWSRNPMYVAYVAIAAGIFLIEGHSALVLYALGYFFLGEVYLRKWEEPALVERFGSDYEEYRRRVPRWVGGSVRPEALHGRWPFA